MYIFSKYSCLTRDLNYTNLYLTNPPPHTPHQKKGKKEKKRQETEKTKLSKGHEWTTHQRGITTDNKYRENILNLINSEIQVKL